MTVQDSKSASQQIETVQKIMDTVESSLRGRTLAVSVGDGLITIEMNGHQQVQSIIIQRALFCSISDEELYWLQDLMMIAINRAIDESKRLEFAQFNQAFDDRHDANS